MSVVALCLWTLLQVVCGDNYTINNDNTTISNVTDSNDPSSVCASQFQYAHSSLPINVAESCNVKSPCISKCCPSKKTLVLNKSDYSLSCVNNTNLSLTYNLTNLDDWSDIEFYENNIEKQQIKSQGKMEHFIQIYNDDFLDDDCYMDISPFFPPPPDDPAHIIYILESGSLVIRQLNFYKQWILEMPSDKYCVGHQIVVDNEIASEPELVFRLAPTNKKEEKSNMKTVVLAYGMLVSCVFLLLVLAVYAVLPQLRNMAGLMLMLYVANLTVAFLLRAILVIVQNSETRDKDTCIWLGLLVNYALVASFTWLNVMSFDIWWSMRGFRKLRTIHRRGVAVKLAWYSLYGWGAPLVPVLFTIIVENYNLSHLPHFVKPHYSNPHSCFMDGTEVLFYLDGPILITTCFNIALFLMTAYNIMRIKQGVSQHSAGSRRNKKDEARFGFYLKLSLVMGINWTLEVVSSFCDPNSKWWYLTDAFNSLIGLIIFIIFIGKKSTIVLLCKRFSIGHGLVQKWQAGDYTCTKTTRMDSKSSKRRMLDSVTDTSDIGQ